MGRDPKQQRVKGNLRPASSSQAQRTITDSGLSQQFPGLADFSILLNKAIETSPSNDESSPPSSLSNLSLMSHSNSLSPELILIFKKLSKKDTQTKLKALDELHTKLKEKNEYCLELVLHWPTFFNRLGIDYDKRIRLCTFTIHALFVSVIGKKLKLILKSIITTWMLGLYDPDVENIAHSSFSSTFPLEKQAALLKFCWSQVIQEVEDIIIKKTPDSMGDPRHYTQEELKNIYSRNVSCAIQLASFLYKFNETILLLESIPFREHIRSPYAPVRKALAYFVQVVIQTKPQEHSWVNFWIEKLSNLIWEEKNPSVSMQWWSVLLLLLKSNPDFFKSIADEKLKNKISKKLPRYISHDIPQIPIGFTALPVFLIYFEAFPLQNVWESAKRLAVTADKIFPSTSKPLWTFLFDILQLMQKRKFDTEAKVIELLTGFLLKNEWSLLMPESSLVFLESFQINLFPNFETTVLELIEMNFSSICIPRTVESLRKWNFSYALNKLTDLALNKLADPHISPPELHASIHFLSYAQVVLKSYLSPTVVLMRSMSHCIECAKRALIWTEPFDENIISLLLSQTEHPLLPLLTVLTPYPSTLLTNFVIEHLEMSDLVEFVLSQGFVNKDKVYSAMFSSHNTSNFNWSDTVIDSMLLAKWSLQNCDDQTWSSLRFEMDIVPLVLDMLLDDTVQPEVWTKCFLRAGSPNSILFSPNTLHRLRYTLVSPLHGRFLDIFQIQEKELFSSITSFKLAQLFQNHDVWEESIDWLYLLALVNASCETFNVPNLNIKCEENILAALFDRLFPLENASPTTADLFAFQCISQRTHLSPSMFLRLSLPTPELHRHRILAALLSGVQQPSTLVEVKCEGWLNSFLETREVTYLMLLNASFLEVDWLNTVLQNEDALLSALDECLSVKDIFIDLHIALFICHYPLSHAAQYCWCWLNHMDKTHPLSPTLIFITIQFLEHATIEPGDKNLLENFCKCLWVDEEIVMPELSNFISTLGCEQFDEHQLFQKLSSKDSHVQLAAFNILKRKIQLNVQKLSLQLSLVDFNVNVPSIELNSVLMNNISTLPSIPKFEEQFRYLLSWGLLLNHFFNASWNLRYLWIQSIQFQPFFNYLMEHLLRKPSSYTLGDWDVTIFYSDSPYLLETPENTLYNLVANLYFQALTLVPKYIRLWWNEIRDKQYKKKIESLTIANFSPLILQRELRDLNSPLESLKVKVSSTSSVTQIQAIYALEDHTIDLSILVPTQYPLLPLDIVGGKQVAISSSKWRAWILTCRTILSQQNASILNVLKTFQSNIQLHLQGVSECSICFSIVGVSCNTLPSKACRTCKNKFHATCLYTWLRTSSQSTCPLCRAQF
ncbi:hypothetical protein HMI54_006487 [Coelomomyces lativittatus]|nr:hypothetical protein HMI56_001094 [Coelomomyces lativittatus]KAJ1514961.1 hypothetical protein HMI55_004171 [Coelomomyces lativittatus]KAJ1517230.1 hypothetical protein HMI54_006487 [Coelomomyces lativittatus]